MYLDALRDHNYQQACDQVEPIQQPDCSDMFSQGLTYTMTGIKVGQVVIDGDRALVSVVGTQCGEQDGDKECSHVTDPNSRMPNKHTTFDQAFAKVIAATGGDQAASALIRSKGVWYVDLGDYNDGPDSTAPAASAA